MIEATGRLRENLSFDTPSAKNLPRLAFSDFEKILGFFPKNSSIVAL